MGARLTSVLPSRLPLLPPLASLSLTRAWRRSADIISTCRSHRFTAAKRHANPIGKGSLTSILRRHRSYITSITSSWRQKTRYCNQFSIPCCLFRERASASTSRHSLPMETSILRLGSRCSRSGARFLRANSLTASSRPYPQTW
jgi:hypothetical protein